MPKLISELGVQKGDVIEVYGYGYRYEVLSTESDHVLARNLDIGGRVEIPLDCMVRIVDPEGDDGSQ